MDRLRFLQLTTAAIGTVGVLVACVPFIGSLKPSARAEAALPRIDISGIEQGTFSILPHPALGDAVREFRWSLFVLRRNDGSVRVWDVPTKDGSVGMPDRYWWLPFYACTRFGPAMVQGRVDEESLLECRDPEAPGGWWAHAWRWDLNGKCIGATCAEDMQVTLGIVEGRYFVYGKRS